MPRRIVPIVPDISLMPKLGFAGYSLAQALGEFIDNSIDARLGSELQDSESSPKLSVKITISDSTIEIEDTGPGMDEQTLIECMTLAHSHKQHSIGRFGLGLKTASLSLGSQFTVSTYQAGQPSKYEIVYDENEWMKSGGKWEIELHTNSIKRTKSFTKITIEKLKVSLRPGYERITQDLSLRYGPYLKARTLMLAINGARCRVPKPQVVRFSRRELDIPMSKYSSLIRTFTNSDRIRGWVALSLAASKEHLWGFTTYWQGRMITIHDKIGLGEDPALSRIIGEIHLDFVPVTHNKREYLKESYEYEAAENAMKEACVEIIRATRVITLESDLQKAITTETNVWIKKLATAFLQSSELQSFGFMSGIGAKSNGKDGNTALLQSPKASQEKSLENLSVVRDPTKPNRSKELSSKSKPRKPSNKLSIAIKGHKFAFSHRFVSLGKTGPWRRYTINDETVVEIYTNVDFPAFIKTKDKAFYALMIIAECLTEIFMARNSSSEYTSDTIKETILKEVSLI